MAQLPDLVDGNVIYANDINARYAENYLWADDADAGGHDLTNVGSITMASGILAGAPEEEDLSGTKDSVNTDFTISRAPSTGGLLVIYHNGIKLKESVGFTRSGTDITLTIAPASDDTLEALIW
jgi:hypothetical protein